VKKVAEVVMLLLLPPPRDTAIYNRVRASCLSVAALAAPSAGCCIAGQTRERRSTAWRLAASAYLLGVLMTERLLHIWTGR